MGRSLVLALAVVAGIGVRSEMTDLPEGTTQYERVTNGMPVVAEPVGHAGRGCRNKERGYADS